MVYSAKVNLKRKKEKEKESKEKTESGKKKNRKIVQDARILKLKKIAAGKKTILTK